MKLHELSSAKFAGPNGSLRAILCWIIDMIEPTVNNIFGQVLEYVSYCPVQIKHVNVRCKRGLGWLPSKRIDQELRPREIKLPN